MIIIYEHTILYTLAEIIIDTLVRTKTKLLDATVFSKFYTTSDGCLTGIVLATTRHVTINNDYKIIELRRINKCYFIKFSHIPIIFHYCEPHSRYDS